MAHSIDLLNAFRFLPRAELDGCELVCREWSTTIERHSSSLSIHLFDKLEIGTTAKKKRQFEWRNGTIVKVEEPSYEKHTFCTSCPGGCKWEVGMLREIGFRKSTLQAPSITGTHHLCHLLHREARRSWELWERNLHASHQGKHPSRVLVSQA